MSDARMSIIKQCSWLFGLIIALFVSINYFVFVYITMYTKWNCDIKAIVFLALFHVTFIMFLWSYFATSYIDPGRVPQYLGFFLENPEEQRKKYCLTCHTYKPERCHHCSICNRCVLNMDHHCPWVSNCVGFYNKKPFVLLLFYVLLNLTITDVAYGIELFNIVHVFSSDGFKGLDYKDYLVVLSCVSISILLFVLAFFFRFHLLLVSKNLTTLENLNMKRGKPTVDYDLGTYNNWIQVFGKDPLMWFFPFYTEPSKPVGDGMIWPRKAMFNDPSSGFDLQVSNENQKNAPMPMKADGQPLASPTGVAPPLFHNYLSFVQNYQNQNGHQYAPAGLRPMN